MRIPAWAIIVGVTVALPLAAGVATFAAYAQPMQPGMTTEEMCREAYDWSVQRIQLEMVATDQELDREHALFNQRLEGILVREEVRADLRQGIRESCGIYLSGVADHAGVSQRWLNETGRADNPVLPLRSVWVNGRESVVYDPSMTR